MMEKELPEGWVSKKLGSVVSYKKGKKPAVLSEEEFENSVPYLDVRALERKEYRQYADKKTSNLVDASCIAILWDGARSGWTSKVVYGAMGSTLAALTPKEDDIDFLFYFLKSQFHYLNSNTRGTGIPHVDPSILWNLEVPIPSLAEQKRIVAKLDEAFKHIEVLKSKLDRIPVLLKQFKQTVLTHAVTGKLTEDWRKAKDTSSWEKERLDTIADMRLGKMLDKQKNTGFDCKYLGNIDVRWNHISLDHLKSVKIDKDEQQKYSLEKGDILVCEGGDPGRAAIWNYEDSNIIYQKALHRIRVDRKLIYPEYFLFQLENLYLIGNIKQLYTGTTIKHLTSVKFKALQFNLPSLEEQKEIIQTVESLFSIADKIESQYKTLKVKTDKLPQALLAKAFKGELVAQNSTDGDAKSLLYAVDQLPELLQVAEEQAAYKKVKKN